MEKAKSIQEILKLKDVQNKTPKKLFPEENKKIDQFHSDHEFLETFINDFQNKNDLSKSLDLKYRKLFDIKMKTEISIKEKLEKIISSEEEFNKNKLFLTIIENDERQIF